MITTDQQAWDAYPQFRDFFNKLWISQQLGYQCGPSGSTPLISAKYIVRPTYNLSGMGVGAEIKWIDAGDTTIVPPGYFWCELFRGRQYSVNYNWDGKWVAVNSFETTPTASALSRFQRWNRSAIQPSPPALLDQLASVGTINCEFIADQLIEVHLRHGPDPDYDTIIPLWGDTDPQLVEELSELGYAFVSSYDDANGFLTNPRIGFMVRNNK